MRASVQTPQPAAPASPTVPLPSGSAVGSFVLRSVHSRDDFGICYLAGSSASDGEVIIEEYLPEAIARRDADGTLGPRSPQHAALWADGLQAFLQESEQMSRLDHPSLLRIGPVWQARGTAYRLRIGGEGRPLTELVTAMTAPPAEAWLRQLLDPLLGALQAMHEAGWVHGNVRPSQIAMRADGSPVLLDSGAVRIAIGERLPEAAGEDAEAGFLPPELNDASLDWPVGPWSDLHALAQVLRYCITGQAPLGGEPGAPLAGADTRPSLGPRSLNARYAPGLVAALERSLVLEPRQRPQSVAEFRHAVDAPVMLRAVPPSGQAHMTPLSAQPPADLPPPVRAEAAPRASTVPFSIDLARERASAPREPAWAASPPLYGAHEQQAQVFDFQAVAGAERRAPPPAARLAGGRAVRRWPWALGGVLAGAALTVAAVVFVELDPSAELRFALGPPGAGPAAQVPADPRLATAPAGATDGVLPSTPLPPNAPGPGPGAAPGATAPIAAAPTAATPTAAAPATAAPVPTAPAPAPTAAAPTAAAPAAAPPANAAVPAQAISQVRQAAPAERGEETQAAARAGDGSGGDRVAGDDEVGPGGVETAESPSSPLAACSPRTNFSLYRCMQTQCERGQYYTHPQCVRLRVRDELP